MKIALLITTSLISNSACYSQEEKRHVLQKVRNTPLIEEFSDRKSSNKKHPRVRGTYCEDTGPLTVVRLKKSPPNAMSIVSNGAAWVDPTFTVSTSALYSDDATRNAAYKGVVDPEIASGALFVDRFPVKAPSATILHPSGDVSLYTDPVSAGGTNEELISSMSSCA